MLQTASFFRWPTWIEDGATWKRSAAKAWMSVSGIHGAPRLASMSPGSTSSGCTCRRASALRAKAGPARLGRGELGPHVAGEVGVGRLPGLGLRVVEDQVAQLGDDLLLRLAVERGDERQIDRALLVEGDEQPFLGAGDRRDGRAFGPPRPSS